MSYPSTPTSKNVLISCVCMLCLLFGNKAIRAQQFNYTLQHDSVSWQELTNQTLCNTVNVAWENSYTIPIGFTFSFAGQQFDSVTINTNGYLVFGRNDRYSVMAFTGFADQVDTAGLHSVLSYSLTGTGNNKILKIQYKNVSRAYMQDFLSYQLWLYADGRVAVLTGPSQIQADTAYSMPFGLVNRLMDTPDMGLLLAGSYTQPNAQAINEQTSTLPVLNQTPVQGHRFVFVPVNN